MKFNGFILLPIFVSFLLASVKPAFATVRCETQYGGTQICVTTGQLQINKEVFDPINKKFVDNLGINNYKFSPGELVAFRITIKNVGDNNLSKVKITDTPQAGFLELVTGSLNYDLTDLKPGESRSQEIKLRVVEASKMPQNNIICVINVVDTSSDNSGELNKDRDTAQLCLERKVEVPVVVKTPSTGAQDWIFAIFGGASSFAGIRLMKFGKYSPKGAAKSHFEEVEDMILKKGRG